MFKKAFLDGIRPVDNYHEVKGDQMVNPPKMDSHVFVKALDDIGNVSLSGTYDLTLLYYFKIYCDL